MSHLYASVLLLLLLRSRFGLRLRLRLGFACILLRISLGSGFGFCLSLGSCFFSGCLFGFYLRAHTGFGLSLLLGTGFGLGFCLSLGDRFFSGSLFGGGLFSRSFLLAVAHGGCTFLLALFVDSGFYTGVFRELLLEQHNGAVVDSGIEVIAVDFNAVFP